MASSVKAVLFDLDGTLVDTEALILASFRYATKTVLGRDIPDEELRAKIGQPLTVGDDEVQPAAEKLASEIADFGFDVVIDDRKERAGVKFADADLIGWPLQVVIGKRGLAEGNVEVKLRRTGQKKDVSLSTIAELLRFAKRNARKHPSGLGAFAGIFE